MSYNGTPVFGTAGLQFLIQKTLRKGETRNDVVLRRDGREFTVGITPGPPGIRLRTGPRLLGSEKEVRIHAMSLIDSADLSPGDSILSLEGRPVPDADTLINLLRNLHDKNLAVVVDRQGEEIHTTAQRDDLIHASYEQEGAPKRPAKVRIASIPPAGQSGLLIGDGILSYHGDLADDSIHLDHLITATSGISELPMVLSREGKEIHLLVPGGPLGITLETIR